jgi:hypothetical protein
MFPTTIIDNFFESPTLIRDYALSLEYSKLPGNYPGKRTEDLNTLNKKLYDQLCYKIFSIFFNLKKEKVRWVIESKFQLTEGRYESGWTHEDGEIFQFAGVVYLNPDAPLNAGTSICDIKSQFHENWSWRDKFYNDQYVDLEEYRTQRNFHNSNFDTTLEISNVFNRCIIYNANQYHKENNFFGTGNDARLTLLFFGNMITFEQTVPPLTRSKTTLTY